MQKVPGWIRLNDRARAARLATMSLLALSLALGTGCFHRGQEEETGEPVPPTVLRVESHAFLDMTIYVYRSSQRVRLGTATGNSSAKFTIPKSLIFGATPLRFLADPIGGSARSVSQETIVN